MSPSENFSSMSCLPPQHKPATCCSPDRAPVCAPGLLACLGDSFSCTKPSPGFSSSGKLSWTFPSLLPTHESGATLLLQHHCAWGYFCGCDHHTAMGGKTVSCTADSTRAWWSTQGREGVLETAGRLVSNPTSSTYSQLCHLRQTLALGRVTHLLNGMIDGNSPLTLKCPAYCLPDGKYSVRHR